MWVWVALVIPWPCLLFQFRLSQRERVEKSSPHAGIAGRACRVLELRARKYVDRKIRPPARARQETIIAAAAAASAVNAVNAAVSAAVSAVTICTIVVAVVWCTRTKGVD